MAKKSLLATGMAVFPHLTVPNTKFSPEGVYETVVRVTQEEADKLEKEIVSYVEDDFIALKLQNKIKNPKIAKNPWHVAVDRDGNEIPGMVDFKVKNGATFKKPDGTLIPWSPKLFDKSGKPWDISQAPWTGSQIAVSFRPYGWYVKGEMGIALRLNAVQILDLVTQDYSAESFGFTVEPSSVISVEETSLKSELKAHLGID